MLRTGVAEDVKPIDGGVRRLSFIGYRDELCPYGQDLCLELDKIIEVKHIENKIQLVFDTEYL
jgi:hypothetical protein